tara:strand:+ start:5353 stop:5589 length:237 start_codon:yes stop_codon:yes gene_type:complete
LVSIPVWNQHYHAIPAVWSFAAIVGATEKLGFTWFLSDKLNAIMAITNLVALIVLSPIVFAVTMEFFDTRGKSKDNPC